MTDNGKLSERSTREIRSGESQSLHLPHTPRFFRRLSPAVVTSQINLMIKMQSWTLVPMGSIRDYRKNEPSD
jgi:hypothetical protein